MHKVIISDKEYTVKFKQNGQLSGEINEQTFNLDLLKKDTHTFHLIQDDKSYNIELIDVDDEEKKVDLKINGALYSGKVLSDLDLLLKEMGMDNLSSKKQKELKAPMPGLVLTINVKPGDEVNEGDKLVVLEAMKMENNLKAEANGTVKEINCTTGQAVEKNEVLLVFE